MKDTRNNVKVVSSSHNTCNLNGVRAILICKNSPEERILRRVREHLLYAKLRSLLPPLDQERDVEDMSEEATEVELEPEELPRRDSDGESANAHHQTSLQSNDEHRENNVVYNIEEDEEEGTSNPFMPSIKIKRMDGSKEMDSDEGSNVVIEIDDVEENITSKPFVPSIKITRMEDSVLIEAIVLKNACLTSVLFRILEEENLDIVFENQYRTETKVAHTIQARLEADYSVDDLARKLRSWAIGSKN